MAVRLGLGHGEAERRLAGNVSCTDAKASNPRKRGTLLRAQVFRNRALNHQRSLWRRLTRETGIAALV